MQAKVYFSKTITGEKVLELLKLLNRDLPKPLAIKLHSGERGNQNYIRPEFWKPVIDEMKGTVVECNTAYDGSRDTDIKHLQLIKDHGWDKYFDFDLMDIGGAEMILDIPNGKKIKKNFVGGHMKNYNSMLVLSHFKGHPMGGYGGALKQLSIGFGSTRGKAHQYSAGVTSDQTRCWQNLCSDKLFKECMADAASSVIEFYKGNMAFINVMKNISIDCDCNGEAAEPCMADIGILASTDPVALDKACLDKIYNSEDPGKKKLIERIEKVYGNHIIDAAVELKIGQKEYDIVEFE